MRLVITFLICISILLSCNSESPKEEISKQNQDTPKETPIESDLDIYELSGKVKKCVETEYLAMEQSGQIIPEDSSIQDQYVYVFNKKGQLLKDQSIYEGVPNSTFIYHYDVNGKLVKKEENTIKPLTAELVEYYYDEDEELVKVSRKNRHGELLEMTSYQYNSMGQLTKAKSYENEYFIGTDSFVYNDQGKVMEEHRIGDKTHEYYSFEYNKEGLKSKIYYHKNPQNKQLAEVFKYDEDQRVSFHRAFDASDSSWTSHSYQYHDNGKVREELYEQFQGTEELLTITQTFNKQGLVIEELSATVIEGTKEEDRLRINYEFDEQQNWIRQVVYENGQPSWLIVRQIDYFK